MRRWLLGDGDRVFVPYNAANQVNDHGSRHSIHAAQVWVPTTRACTTNPVSRVAVVCMVAVCCVRYLPHRWYHVFVQFA